MAKKMNTANPNRRSNSNRQPLPGWAANNQIIQKHKGKKFYPQNLPVKKKDFTFAIEKQPFRKQPFRN